METAYDSSILVSALSEAEDDHTVCAQLLHRNHATVYIHALAETFATLTGGNLKVRIGANAAAALIEEAVLPHVSVVALTVPQVLDSLKEAEQRGVRGGAIHDYLHLAAARTHGAARLCTLDVGDFRSFWRAGDPEIVHP